MTKAEQRKIGIQGRKSISGAQRERFDRAICERIAESAEFREASVLLLYKSFGGEVSVDAIADKARMLGKTVAYPFCVGAGVMLALAPDDDEAWEKGKYGIMSPVREHSRELAPEEIGLVIAPCAAFDSSRNRVGMGGGYYDRYLPKCVNAYTMLAAYEAQRVSEIQTEPTDFQVACVITEQNRE